MQIGKAIIDWYETQGRKLPWRETRNPYFIWISEIVLQQTRVAQGQAYYERFIKRFPDVESLAAANLDEVLKYWEGLGYYARARNLHSAAKQIVEDLNGTFPTDYREWMKLKGIGPYTARAIGSFAFDNNTGVVDGNVLRLVSRVQGRFSPINLSKSKKEIQNEVDQWVSGLASAPFNQGIMDIGSTICTPTKPACMICPLESYCVARKEGIIHLLPVKEKKAAKKIRYFYFYLFRSEGQEILIRQRPQKGLWGGLWEIPNREVSQELWESAKDEIPGQMLMRLSHVFTHFKMMIRVFESRELPKADWAEGQFISTEKIANFAFSRAVLNIFQQCL